MPQSDAQWSWWASELQPKNEGVEDFPSLAHTKSLPPAEAHAGWFQTFQPLNMKVSSTLHCLTNWKPEKRTYSRTYVKTKWKTYVKHLKYKLYPINLSQSFWLLFWRSTVEGELDPKWQPLILCQDEKHNHTYKQKDGLVNENLHACLRHFISKVDKGREQHLLITFFIQTSHQLEHIMDLASCHKATSCSSSGCPSYVVWKKRRVIWWCSSDESWSKKELGLKGSDQVLIIVWNGMAQTIIFGLCYCHITID